MYFIFFFNNGVLGNSKEKVLGGKNAFLLIESQNWLNCFN